MTTAATTTKKFMKDQEIVRGQAIQGVEDLTTVLQPGDYISAPLVTDTVVYQVVKVTPKTVTLRSTRTVSDVSYVDERCGTGGYGTEVRWHAVEGVDGEGHITKRLGKDGGIKVGSWARAGYFRKCMTVNGQAVKRIDWRY